MNKKLKNILLWIFTGIIAVTLGFGLQHIVATSGHKEIKNKQINFTVADNLDTPLNISDLTGKPVVINFWAIWCAPCLQELPVMQKAYDEYSGQVEFVFINVLNWQNNNITEVENFIYENGYTFHTYYDIEGYAEDACNLTSIPFTLFLDKSGKVMHTYSGPINDITMNSYIQGLL